MASRRGIRALSAVAALGLIALAASPAAAATEVAKGAASAVTVSLAGNVQGTGTYTASNDGTAQTTSGTHTPPLTVLGGFSGAAAGTLNQDATTTTASRASACAGLAGNGATVVAVGRSSCLQPKDTLALAAGTVDLTKLDPSRDVLDSAFNQAVLGQLPGTPTAALTPLTGALTTAFQSAFTALGNPALSLDLGVIQASCTAAPGNVGGAADLAGASLVVTFPAASGIGPVTLLDLPVDPDPNTTITVDLGQVVAKALAAAGASFATSASSIPGLGAAVAALAAPLDQTKVITDGLRTVTSQLSPLDAVISGTLNKQTRPDDSSIDVTALDLDVLSAASAVIDGPLVSLQVGHVSCAAADGARVDAPASPIVDASVPTAIDSGLPGESHADLYRTLLGVLLLVGAGGIAVRRLLAARSSD